MNFLATFLGIKAKLSLSYCGLLTHAIYTISVIGGFYIYIFIDYFMTENNGDNIDSPGRISSTFGLILTSLPLLALFGMGIYSCVLAIMVEDELDARKQ